MNRFLSRHGARARCAVAVLAATSFGVTFHAAGADPFSSVLVPVAVGAMLVSRPSREGVLGISYPIATAKTKASALVDTPLSEQQLWAKTLFLNEDMQYEDVSLPLNTSRTAN